MGWALRFCVVVCFVAGSCGAVMGQAKPSVVFEIDKAKLGHVWVHYCVGVSSASFSSDSRLLAVACGNKVRVWSLAFSPDGRFVAWHERHASRRRILRVWDSIEHEVAASIALDEYVKPLELVHYVGFTDDGEWLKTIAERRVSRGYVHEVRYWSVGEFSPGGRLGATAQTLSSDGLMRAHLSPDGEVLELMDMTTRKSIVCPRFLPAPPGLRYFPETPLGLAALGTPSIRFSRDKRLLAVATFHTRYLLLWGVNTGREYARLAQPAGFMWPVAFSPNDRYLFTISGLMTPVETEILGTVWDLGRENPTPKRPDEYPR